MALGLAGCASGTLTGTLWADRLGRRRTLMMLGMLMALGGIVTALTQHFMFLAFGFALGMINGMGRDRGLGLTVEQAMLAQLSGHQERTLRFAWYNVAVDSGNALGALMALLPALLRQQWHLDTLPSYQWTWCFYAVLCLASALLPLGISDAVESPTPSEKSLPHLSAESRPRIFKFAALSGLDSLGGGFLSTALLSYWFFQRFGVSEVFLGPLFFVARLANGLSHLGAAWLAKRIGLVNTMVFTHLPSSLLLLTIPFMPNLPVASILFVLRECLVEMDVPTRQSYIVAVVKPEERLAAAGITNLTRGAAWALGPLLASPLIAVGGAAIPLLVGPSIKVVYDLCLYRAFKHIKPPEEMVKAAK